MGWFAASVVMSCTLGYTPVDNFFRLMGLTIHCTTVSRDLVSPPADPRPWLAYELLSVHLESEMCDACIARSLDVRKRLTLRYRKTLAVGGVANSGIGSSQHFTSPKPPLTYTTCTLSTPELSSTCKPVSLSSPLNSSLMADNRKKNVLIIGGGAVGAIAALGLEAGGLATVTVVLRSSFAAVNSSGYSITSCDHGVLKGWKPSHGSRPLLPT